MGKRLRPLSGLDALFLYLEAGGTPMHVAGLMRLERPRRVRDFAVHVRNHLAARLAPLPILRRVLVDAPLALGHPVWREADHVDLDRHVVIRKVARPGGEAQLATLVATLHAEPLDRGHPLWQVVVIDGLADGGVAVYLKSHHALVDGQAGVQVTAAIVDVEPRPAQRAVPPTTGGGGEAADTPVARTALRATAQQFSRMLRGVPASLKALREQARDGAMLERLRDSVWVAPRTPFNVNVGPRRRVAFASLPLPALKRVARHFGVSLNDVVMALVADALRGYLARRGELPEAPLVAAMPVSLRETGQDAGNAVSMVQCPLATDIADPVARLRGIAAATRQIKGRVGAFRGLIPTDFPGFAAPIWATGLSHLWQRGRLSERLPALANLVVSNVPGPPLPLYLAGARIRHWHPVSIITHGLGVNLTLLSYAESMECCVVSSPETLPRPAVLCSGLQRALDRLLRELPA